MMTSSKNRGSPAALIVANHVLLENDAVDATALLRSFPRPLLARICRGALRDEARHVALGRRLLRHELAHVDAVTRRDIYCWAYDIWLACANATLHRYGSARALLLWFGGHDVEALWLRHSRRLEAAGLIAEETAP